MIKKIFMPLLGGIFFSCLTLLGLDGYKHYRLLDEIEKILSKNAVTVDGSLSFNRRGFFVTLDDLKGKFLQCHTVSMIIPWNSLSRVSMTGKNLHFSSLKVSDVASQIEIDKTDSSHTSTQVPFFDLDHAKLWGLEIKDIRGSFSLKHSMATFDITFFDISRHEKNKFDMTLKGHIDHVDEEEIRAGDIHVSISHVKNLVRTLSDMAFINSFQKSIILNYLEDSVTFLVNLKKNSLYLGPLKIYSFSR